MAWLAGEGASGAIVPTSICPPRAIRNRVRKRVQFFILINGTDNYTKT